MSIYSGFATRQIEQTYNILVEQLFRVLQRRILKFYRQEEANEHIFQDCLKKLLTQMSFFERQKHLPPKFSDNCKQLSSFLQLAIPPNISEFGKKKKKTISQKQLPQETNQTDQINGQQNNQFPNQENNNYYGEPQKSVISLKKYPQQIIGYSSVSEGNASQKNIKKSKSDMNEDYEKEEQRIQNETKQNYVTLDAAYINSSPSSISPSNSLQSSFLSLQKNNQLHKNIDQLPQQLLKTHMKSNNISPSKQSYQDSTAKLQQQIQQIKNDINSKLVEENKNQSFIIAPKKTEIIDQNVQKQNNHSLDQSKQESVKNSQRIFRVTKKPGLLNQASSTQSSQYQSTLQTQQTLSPQSKQFIIPEESQEQSLIHIQTVENNNDGVQNKKLKNKRSHTTKRQRKRNQLLNQVYLNGEDQQFESKTAAFTHIIPSKRSRSSQRSQENAQISNNLVQYKHIQQNNLLQRSNSIDNQKSIDNLLQIRQGKKSREHIIVSNENRSRCNSFTNYNPLVQLNGNENNSLLIQQNNQYDDNSKQYPKLDTPSNLTVYSIRSQLSDQLKKNQENQTNQSMMVESSNSRIAKYKLMLSAIDKDQDKEPQHSVVSPLKNQNNNKSDYIVNQINKQNNSSNNSSFEIKSMFYPMNQNTNNSNIQQRHRILSNNSLNNSLLSTQNNFKIKQKNDSSSGTESSNFDQMYKNNTKRSSIPYTSAKNYSNSNKLAKQYSKKRISEIENGNISKTINSESDQSFQENPSQKINYNKNFKKEQYISPSNTSNILFSQQCLTEMHENQLKHNNQLN